jgi:hypothetical protein
MRREAKPRRDRAEHGTGAAGRLLAWPDFASVHGVTVDGVKNHAVNQHCDMVLTPISKLSPAKPLPGVEFVGPVPDPLNAYMESAAAIPAAAREPAVSRVFFKYLKRSQSQEA